MTSKWQIWGVGALIGVVSFWISMAFVRVDFQGGLEELSSHDLQLANNLGFIFPPFVGFWAGLFRRSLSWTFVGIGVGLAIGSLYRLLCGYDFLAVMVAYPTLLGGIAAAALGRTGPRDWLSDVVLRFVKGLAAGLVLGFVYVVVLNVLGLILLPTFDPAVRNYRQMMWIAGTVAMGVASGLYLVLFHWSANLKDKAAAGVSAEGRSAEEQNQLRG